MSIYTEIAKNKVANLKKTGQNREFRTINRICGQYPTAWLNDNPDFKVTVWCSNDYLGMGEDEKLKKIAHDTIESYGIGSGGSRNISGTHLMLNKLEQSLADWHEKESALVYTTGYVANDSSIQCLVNAFGNDTIIFSDELNHASIISGIRNSNCEKYIFKHNKIEELESALKKHPIDRPKIIVFESIYSMDGDFSPISDIVNLAKKYNAFTFLDEVHAVGIYGPKGAGLASLQGVQSEIDVIQGTLGKSIGGIGGYVSGSSDIIDLIRAFSSGFIFTTTLPPLIAATSIAAIEMFKKDSTKRDKLLLNSKILRKSLKENNFVIMNNVDSHIIPILVGDMSKCKAASNRLLNDYNIYIQPINFPSVAKGTERFRINATPQHTEQNISYLVESLIKVFREYDIPFNNR